MSCTVAWSSISQSHTLLTGARPAWRGLLLLSHHCHRRACSRDTKTGSTNSQHTQTCTYVYNSTDPYVYIYIIHNIVLLFLTTSLGKPNPNFLPLYTYYAIWTRVYKVFSINIYLAIVLSPSRIMMLSTLPWS